MFDVIEYTLIMLFYSFVVMNNISEWIFFLDINELKHCWYNHVISQIPKEKIQMNEISELGIILFYWKPQIHSVYI